MHKGDMLPTPLLPSVPIAAELGRTLVTSPLPNLAGRPETDGEAPSSRPRPRSAPAPRARSSAPR